MKYNTITASRFRVPLKRTIGSYGIYGYGSKSGNTAPTRVARPIFAHRRLPSMLSSGCNVKVIKGQMSRYEYTASTATVTKDRCHEKVNA